MDIVALDDDVAEVDSDAEYHPAVGRQGGIALGLGALHVDGTPQRIDNAVELDQESIPHGLDKPAVVICDIGLEHLVKLGLEMSASSFLVRLAEMPITSDVGNHHSGKPALHAAHSTLLEVMLLPPSDSAPI
jgi:hypothetical protein